MGTQIYHLVCLETMVDELNCLWKRSPNIGGSIEEYMMNAIWIVPRNLTIVYKD